MHSMVCLVDKIFAVHVRMASRLCVSSLAIEARYTGKIRLSTVLLLHGLLMSTLGVMAISRDVREIQEHSCDDVEV